MGQLEDLFGRQDTITGSVDRRVLWDDEVDKTRTTLEVDRQIRER